MEEYEPERMCFQQVQDVRSLSQKKLKIISTADHYNQ